MACSKWGRCRPSLDPFLRAMGCHSFDSPGKGSEGPQVTLRGYSQSSLQSTALSRTWPGALAPAGYRVGCLHLHCPAGAVGRCSALACPDHRSSLCLTGQSFHGVPGVRVGYESWEGCCSGSSPLSCASSAAQRSGSIKVSPCVFCSPGLASAVDNRVLLVPRLRQLFPWQL